VVSIEGPVYEEHWEDGILRMKYVVKEDVVEYVPPCPPDIDEKDYKNLHKGAKYLLSLRGRKPIVSFWKNGSMSDTL
jgi:hypothetical protein